ncbi:MAG: restriction endonuclease, partial [Clostridia bacterium]|nr:restriction endonuclease [Clostridia bacterium]
KGTLPILFTSIGRWWGSDPVNRKAIEIDLIASDGKQYIIGECKWRNEPLDVPVMKTLREKADVFYAKREKTWYMFFSKSGFTDGAIREARRCDDIILVDLQDML